MTQRNVLGPKADSPPARLKDCLVLFCNGGRSGILSRALGNSPENEEVYDTLKMSDSDWYACVSEMDRRSSRSTGHHEQRRHERLPYRNSVYVVIAVHNYDDTVQRFKVRTYDLSESGIGFLHGAYIHANTHVELMMEHREIGRIIIDATIRSCSHVKKTIHRVGAEFEKPINLDDFLLAQVG